MTDPQNRRCEMKQLPLLPGQDNTAPGEHEPAAPAMPVVRAELGVTLLESGARLSLAAAEPGGIRCLGTATLEVTPPVRMRSGLVVEGARRARQTSAPPRRERRGLDGGLLPLPRSGCLDPGDPFFQMFLRRAQQAPGAQPGAGARLDAMERDLGRAGAHLSSLLAVGGVAAARGFEEPATWWDVYKVAAEDRTGRLGQLARTCPGLMLLLFALPREDRRRTFDAVLAGQRLNRALDQAVEVWMRQSLRGCPRSLLPPADERRRMAKDQRVRIRRASPLVDRQLLLKPPPPLLVPEDIPRDPARNRDWFVITSVFGLPWTDWFRQRDLLPVRRDGLSRFLSRQGSALCELAGLSPGESPMEVMILVTHLLDYVRFAGRALDRKTSPGRVLRELEAWNAAMGDSQRVPPHTELHTHGLDDWQGPGGTVRPLRTVGELVDETHAMSHCVASIADRGVAGLAVFLHGELAGEPLTINVEPAGAGFHLVDVRGVRNREPTADEREVVNRWLRDVNAHAPGTRSRAR